MGQECSRQFCRQTNIQNVEIHKTEPNNIQLTKQQQQEVQVVGLDFQLVEKVKQQQFRQLQFKYQEKTILQFWSNPQNHQNLTDFISFIQIYQSIIMHHHQHNIDKAFALSKQLETLQEKISEQRELSKQSFQEKLKNVWNEINKQNLGLQTQQFDRSILQKIVIQYEDMIYYFNQSIRAPFIQRYSKKGIRISTRKDEKNIGFLVETELHSSFQNLTVFFSNVTFFPDIVPFCEKAVLLKSGGRNSKIGYGIIDFPMIAKREVFFEVLAYNRMQQKKEIFLYARSVHDKPQVQKALGVEAKINPDFVQLGFRYFVIRYEPLAEKVGNLKISANFDFGIDYLPQFIQNFVVKEFGKKFIKQILEINEKFQGSVWQKSLQQNPQLHNLVKEKIEGYLRQMKEVNKDK